MLGLGIFLLVLALLFALLAIFITSPPGPTPHEATTTTLRAASAPLPRTQWAEVQAEAFVPRTDRAEASRSQSAPRPRPTSTTVVTTPHRPQNGPTSDIWTLLGNCESGNNPAKNTGNGYYGAFQFLPSTWHSLGLPGLPHTYSYEAQLAAAKRLQARSGWGQWPSCARQLHLL